MSSIILSLGLVYFLARGLVLVFDRFQIPDVLILMLLGMVLGPITGIVDPKVFGSVGRVITTIALVIILFEGGVGLSLDSLKKSCRLTLGITLWSSLFTAVLGALCFKYLVGFLGEGASVEWLDAFILGAIICGTSAAVVIPMVKALKLSEKGSDILILESAVTDVLCIVLSVAFWEAAVNKTDLNPGRLSLSILGNLTLSSVLGVAAGMLWVRVWKWAQSFKENLFTTVAFLFVIYGLSEQIYLSGGIAAMSFGVVLGNRSLRPRWVFKEAQQPELSDAEKNLYSELVFLLKTFFFVYLGILLPLKEGGPHIVAAAIVGSVYLMRWFVGGALLKSVVEARDLSVIRVMVPKGLAAAVLAGIPSQLGLTSGVYIEQVVYAIVLQSIVLTSFLVWLQGKRDVKSQ